MPTLSRPGARRDQSRARSGHQQRRRDALTAWRRSLVARRVPLAQMVVGVATDRHIESRIEFWSAFWRVGATWQSPGLLSTFPTGKSAHPIPNQLPSHVPKSAMLAKTLPLLLLCACVATPPIRAPAQPELARLAQHYANELRAVGIKRLVASGSDAMVHLETLSGPVYFRYPQGIPAVALALDVESDRVQATAQGFDPDRDQRVLRALLPEAIAVAASNNALVWIHRNPWN
jgi:hypothetical protein